MKKANDLDLLRRVEFSYLTDDEFAYFVAFCQEKGLNPWLRHIKPRRVFNESAQRNELQMIVTITALRVIALDTGRHQGVAGPSWCGKDGAWRDVWLDIVPPHAAMVSVFRKGFRQPVVATAPWDSYCPRDRSGKLNPTEFWVRMPAFMLGKCAEAMALRAAFPERLSGLFTDDELQQGVPSAPRGDKPSPDGSLRGWDSAAPTTPFQFHLALSEMGIQDPKKRENLISYFSALHPWDESNPQTFYKYVIDAVQKHPDAYGAKLEHGMG